MAQSVIRSLSEDFVHCTICTEPYKEPKMLPCLHSFCLNCLTQWAKNSQDQSLACPSCRYKVDLSSKGVVGLPQNFFLVSLKERLEEASRLSSQDQNYNCNICRNKMGTMFCIDCKMHICQDCKETHDRLTKRSDHPMIPSDKITDESFLQKVIASQAPHCYTHKQEKVRYYCTQCSELACQVCATVVHQGHQSLQEVENIVTAVKDQLETLLGESKVQTDNEQHNLELTKKATDEINCHISTLLKEVDNHFDEIVQKLQSDKEKLTKELRHIQETQSGPVRDIERKIFDWLKAMKNTQEITRTILQQNNSWDILEMKNKLIDSFERLRLDKEKEYTTQRLPTMMRLLLDISTGNVDTEQRRSRPLPRRMKLKLHPAKLCVADKSEKRKKTEDTRSGDLLMDNFIGDVSVVGYSDREWLL